MIVIAAAALCVVLFPLIGGRVSSLTRFRMRHETLVVVLFTVQAVLRGRLPGAGEPSAWAVFGWGVAALALIGVLLPSRRHTGVMIVVLGLASNLWVILLNQGMPYVTDSRLPVPGAGGFYRLATSATYLPWMGDVLPDPTGRWLLSLGDVLLLVGVIAIVLSAASAQQPTGGVDALHRRSHG